MRRALVLCLFVTLGCERDSAPTPVASAPPIEIDEQTLAAAGYYGGARAHNAWSERRRAGVRGVDGSELVGTAPPEWNLSDWVGSEPLTLSGLRGKVVVVRFWTSPDCPFCRKTLPAIEQLAGEFKGKPVVFIGAYHAKPVTAVSAMEQPAKLAREWGVTFPVALDREWRTLRAWWLEGSPRNATSVTFVIDKDGSIAFVHPGPEFFASDDPAKARQNRDFVAVRAAIVAALATE